MRIFITGGVGFIGSNLVETLLTLGYIVTVYDNLSSPSYNNLELFMTHRNFSFVKGDVCDFDLLDASIKDHDIVVHLAAQLEITKSYTNPIYDLNINLIGTMNVIKACRNNKISRLINASSACVYGFTSGAPSKETDSMNPNWEYGISKLAAEKYIQISNLDYTSLRFSIVFGPHEHYGRVLPIFVKRAIDGNDLVIFGDGSQTRDYVHVYDVVKFILECMNNPNTINKVYNVSSGNGTTINDLAKLVASKFDDINIIYDNVEEGSVSNIVVGRERLKNELPCLLLDNTLAKTDTTWAPKYSIQDSITEYITWARRCSQNWIKYKV
jgi:UDP-glucose 4-epimerase